MTSLEMVLLGMSIVALIAAYFLNNLDISKWNKRHSHE